MLRLSDHPRSRPAGWPSALRGLLAVGGALLMVGCATYRDDLDRAITHYHANEYDQSLALLEVLEPDLDSLSPAERARYAYYRGMSHFRLRQRRDARHWLGRSAAREKAAPGSLSGEEKKRDADTLTELNKDRWGGAETPAAEQTTCTLDADCGKDQFCDAGSCKDSPLSGGEQPSPASTSAPPAGDAAAPSTGN